ncbi:coilin isoform X2 [Anthonomus grandis grandis]|uniref:coilin isoform X2 n=1 Tax=Anthonomus grandis grandis TaxID=2921223 RepID=UPI002166AAC8|nr:coilin isoform X2 [Anthonomus grandis grandis]
MSETRNFRITLDLSRFFNDHRRLAKIFINNNLESIQDLQDRIHAIFGLSGFYLTTQNHFLPLSEDVRVLVNDETVCAIPCSQPEEVPLSIQNTNGVKHPLETIAEESIDNSFTKRKSKKRNTEEVTSDYELPMKKKKHKTSKSESSPTISEKIKKHKTHRKPKIVEQSVCNIESTKKCNEIKEKFEQKVYAGNYDNLGRPIREDFVRLSRHADTPVKVFSKYKKPQRNTEEYIAKNKINIVRIDIIKDSNNASDSAFEKLNERQGTRDPESPPENIVKSIVNNIEKNISPTLEENCKKESLNNSEKSGNLQGQQNKQELQLEASDYTKHSLDKRNTDTISNESDLNHSFMNESFENTNIRAKLSQDAGLDASSLSSMNNSLKDDTSLKNSERTNYGVTTEISQNVALNASFLPSTHNSLKNAEIKNYQITQTGCGVSQDASSFSSVNNSLKNAESKNYQITRTGSEISQDVNGSSIYTIDSSTKIAESKNDHKVTRSLEGSINAGIKDLNTSMETSPVAVEDNSYNHTNTNFKMRRNSFKTYSGIGSLLEQLKESDSVISQDSDNSLQFITKRKRIRHRKRKNKKNDSVDCNSSFEAYVPPIRPLKIDACPKLHITFDEEESDQNKTKENNRAETKIEEVKDVIILNEEPEDPVLENKSIFSEDSILKAPMMRDTLPNIGNVIAFQFIKLSDNYSPTVSNYVVGMVLAWEEETKTVQLKILCGEQELKTPSGKLSLNVEEEEEKKTSRFTIKWEKMLLPRLLFP